MELPYIDSKEIEECLESPRTHILDEAFDTDRLGRLHPQRERGESEWLDQANDPEVFAKHEQILA